jgi:hypothetical protein
LILTYQAICLLGHLGLGFLLHFHYIYFIMIKIESKEEFKTTIFSVVKEDEKGETKMYLVTHQDSFDDFLMTEWDVRDEMNNLIEDEGVTSELIEYCKSQL